VAAGQPIVIRGATERALLSRLALDANRPVSIDRIAEDLWDDQAPRRPKQAIHALVFRLRQALGESAATLQASDRGYLLRLVPSRARQLEFVSPVRSIRNPSDRWS
jgi:DNA-binding SARP family transcriptional activator